MRDDHGTDLSRRRFLLQAGMAASGTAVLSSWPLGRAHGAVPPRIKLGQVAPFSGSAGGFGPFYADAARLGVKQINAAARRVLGGAIIDDLVTADTGTLPRTGIAAAQKLIRTADVPAIIGGWSSGVTAAIAKSTTLPAGVLQVANGATSPLISVLPADREHDLLFRTTGSDALQGIVAAQLARGDIVPGHEFSSASTLYINNAYGRGLSNAFARAFQQRGGRVYAQVPHEIGLQSSYRVQLAMALRHDPDVLLVPSYPTHTSRILEESRDVFGFTSWQLTDSNESEDVLHAVGADTLNGTYGTVPAVNEDSRAYKDFKSTYMQQFDRSRIPPFTASTYDAAVIIGLALAQAIVRGHITSAAAISGDVIRDQLRAVAGPPGEHISGGSVAGITHAMQLIAAGKDIDFTGAAGPDDFDAQGDVVTPYAVWQVTDGQIQQVRMWSTDKISAQLT